jgi:hypothetical protein
MRELGAKHQNSAHLRFARGVLRVLTCLAPVLIAGAAQAKPDTAFPCSPAFDTSRSLWAAADFDGDKSIDLARVRVHGDRHTIVISGAGLFSLCPNSIPPAASFLPQLGLVLSAQDIDADDDQDLVLRNPLAGDALGVWLNDGTGKFSEAEPSNFPATDSDPLSLRKPSSRIGEAAVSSSSKTYPSVLRRALARPRARRKLRSVLQSSIRVASASRDPRQSRAPPLLSF